MTDEELNRQIARIFGEPFAAADYATNWGAAWGLVEHLQHLARRGDTEPLEKMARALGNGTRPNSLRSFLASVTPRKITQAFLEAMSEGSSIED